MNTRLTFFERFPDVIAIFSALTRPNAASLAGHDVRVDCMAIELYRNVNFVDFGLLHELLVAQT